MANNAVLPPQLQRVLEAPDLTADDVAALGVGANDGAEAKAQAINEAKHALRHLAKSVAVLSSRCNQGAYVSIAPKVNHGKVLGKIDECSAAVHTTHDKFVELGRVRKELQRRMQTLDAEIAVCDSELKAGVRHKPPPIEVDLPGEDELSPWDETPVNSPKTRNNHKSPHHLLRSAANSVDYSSPRSSLGSIKEDVLVAVLA